MRISADGSARSDPRHGNRLFVASVLALVATAFGFVTRAMLLGTLSAAFNLTVSQAGALQGAGLFPFALSILACSLVIDRIGYGRAMLVAWVLHLASAIITLTAASYTALYIGTILFSLANGIVEAVVNPMTVALFPRRRTARLILLHSGWAAGLVLGGVVAIARGDLGWRWTIDLFVLPTLLYGLMMLGQPFPTPERGAATRGDDGMIRDIGWVGTLIIGTFAVYAINELALVLARPILPTRLAFITAVAYALVPTAIVGARYRSAGRPIFIALLLVMVPVAATELGTSSWIPALLTPMLAHAGAGAGAGAGDWVLLYTSTIMFGLRFAAGPIVRRLTPVGLLIGCSLLAAIGLFGLAHAGTSPLRLVAAATLFGVGTALSWPTMIGLASEQSPRGGALTINAISAIGMISVGVLGGPLLGTLQDARLDRSLQRVDPALHAAIAGRTQHQFGFDYQPLDKAKITALSVADRSQISALVARSNQATLAQIAILPALTCAAFVVIGAVLARRRGDGAHGADGLHRHPAFATPPPDVGGVG